MKEKSIVILTEELQQAVKLAKPFASKKHDLIRINTHSAVMVDSSGASGFEREFTFLYSSSEEVIVKVSELKKALASYKGHTVTLDRFNNLVIVNDRIRINEYSHDTSIYYPESKPYEERVEVNASNLQTAIKKVARFASDAQTAPVLNCIRFTMKPDAMELVATDRHRLARYTYNLDHDNHIPEHSFNLYAPYVNLLTTIKPVYKSIELFSNRFANYTEFRIDNRIRIRIKHDDSTYPDVSKIVSACHSYNSWMQFDRADMLATLKDLKRCTSDKLKTAIIQYNDDRATVANNVNNATYQTTIDVTTSNNESFRGGFNAEFMIDALETLDYKVALLKYSSERINPLFIYDSTEEYSHDILIIPFRLKELETVNA
jgi:DNA polymerase III sliding clamp (beta) subunit (PCNA family)